MPNLSHSYDVLIVGSGASGLATALRLPGHLRIAILSKVQLTEGSTYYAQGGISAVLDANDSLASHCKDTMIAGGGLCHPDIVEMVVAQGKECVDWLLDQKVSFTRDLPSATSNGLHLTKEGGHSYRRVVHAEDTTGKAVELSLVDQVKARPNVVTLDHHCAVDLIVSQHKGPEKRILGAYVLDKHKDAVYPLSARSVVLATGGASKVYLYTSNPDVSTGDGIAMAWRAGCRVANMEFIQFHPTCLFHPHAKSFLISEAVRGEGGFLVLPDGTRFMPEFDQRAELAPRDIVARAIDHEMKRLGIDSVFLDISHKDPDFIRQHFPMLYRRCLEFGFDMTRERIPVVPAAHYTCGGIHTDQHGASDIAGLYAIGEAAFTGLHGANRMASNSLLECMVFAKQAAQHIQGYLQQAPDPGSLKPWDASRVIDSDEKIVVSHNWAELRQFMWDYVGIVRSTKRLQRAKRRIDLLKQEIQEYYSNFNVSSDLLELRNLVVVAELIIDSALLRKESRGLHYTLDYPDVDDRHFLIDTILIP